MQYIISLWTILTIFSAIFKIYWIQLICWNILILFYSAFTAENVEIETGYPMVEDVNSIMVFVVTIPKTGLRNANVYVKKAAVAGKKINFNANLF